MRKKLTEQQADCLAWLHARGGTALVDAYSRIVAGGDVRGRDSAFPLLRLVASGLISGGDDRLHLTETGREEAELVTRRRAETSAKVRAESIRRP